MIAPIKPDEPKFNLGKVVATPGAIEALEKSGESADAFIRRHHTGDWGDVCQEDSAANDGALENDDRILSVYHTSEAVKLYVITEQDRSSTCILLPEEY